jgi:drug/metabolite transporter (DMT)-like permease
MQLNRRQLILLVLLTLVWGFNWPVMKLGVTDYPPLAFRMLCMWLGLPVMALSIVVLKHSFVVPREHWRELFWLGVTNSLVWQVLVVLSLANLSSGRAAILAYSMPVFSALLSVMYFGERLGLRSLLGVLAATGGVVLLLWHEVAVLSGTPWWVLCSLLAAATWALGMRRMRATRIPATTLTLSFWMACMTVLALTLLSSLFEREAWAWPTPTVWGSVGYNAVLVFGFAVTTQMYLARTLPPLAASLSVMLIPILGVFSGAILLGEVLHWQDWAAVVLMVGAIGSVLMPQRTPPKLG